MKRSNVKIQTEINTKFKFYRGTLVNNKYIFLFFRKLITALKLFLAQHLFEMYQLVSKLKV